LKTININQMMATRVLQNPAECLIIKTTERMFI
jgi:hypothetical protein